MRATSCPSTLRNWARHPPTYVSRIAFSGILPTPLAKRFFRLSSERPALKLAGNLQGFFSLISSRFRHTVYI
jgi:hypothetical protein